MQPNRIIYEGKAKKIYATGAENLVLMVFKDEATALDGAKKGIIENKGIMNNRISNLLYEVLEQNGIETHLVKPVDDRSVLVKKMDMVPLEVVVRNVVAGSLVKRLGKPEGTELKSTVVEYYYKDDALHDPMVNQCHIKAMGWAQPEHLKEMQARALAVNTILKELFAQINIILVDFKLEFGFYEGRIVLGDEISPDSCRLWDRKSLEKLDKDRFRRDMGQESEAYREVMVRLEKYMANRRGNRLKARVYITLKPGVLDPQGEAVKKSLHVLGYEEVEEVRMGKFIELGLQSRDKSAAKREVEELSHKLLANPVIEDYRVEVLEDETT